MIALCALLSVAAYADKVTLKSGSFLTGKAGLVQDGKLTFTSDDLGEVKIDVANIADLDVAKEAFFSWGIDLEVTPRISTNGLINVSIVPTISSRTDWVTAGASDTSEDADSNAGTYSAKYPVINVQRLITEFNMSSETTAVIGGLSRTIETQKDNGIPWLRDIWWI